AITIGNICISKSKYIDDDRKRTFHYGNPGRFRPQPWGCEYRSPSNSWIENLDTIELIFEGGKRAFYLLNNPDEGKDIVDKFLGLTIKSIKTADKELAYSIINEVI
ncbi:hypothetical protein LCGC14_1917330, partial [marine sediment metagenome]